jgi:hypothetical protein
MLNKKSNTALISIYKELLISIFDKAKEFVGVDDYFNLETVYTQISHSNFLLHI